MWGGIFGIVIIFIFGSLERGGPGMNDYYCPEYCLIDHKHKEKKSESYTEYIERKQANNCECNFRSRSKTEGCKSHQRQCRYSIYRRVDRSQNN
jgi:hypothetical protein